MRTTGLLSTALLCLCACGGGGGSAPDPVSGPQPANPDVALLCVSGHQGLLDDSPSLSYLDLDLGPELVADLEAAGYRVDVGYYVDHPTATDMPGYDGLVADLRWIRDNWVRSQQRPTKVIVVAHSHGGVWATAAIREVSDLTIHLQVALDHCSYGWGTVGHTAHDAVIGGDPRDAYRIEASKSCQSYEDGWCDSGFTYDLEDVVFPNVVRHLEVRSGDPVLLGEPWDEKWDIRTPPSWDRLHDYYAGTDHGEVHATDGPTYPLVLDFLLAYLRE